jgi:serine O-acetyltransferase
LIQSKEDYKFYLAADRLSLLPNLPLPLTLRQKIKYFLTCSASKECYKFQVLLRKTEFYLNCSKTFLGRAYAAFLWYRLNRAGLKLGFEISPNCFGPGLAITHPGTIIVNPQAKIGANCRIHPGVIIGIGAGRSEKLPVICDNVFIGPGAKIFGNIIIADGIAVGANSVVNSSFLEPGITIAGCPARKVSSKGSKNILVPATQIITQKKPEATIPKQALSKSELENQPAIIS